MHVGSKPLLDIEALAELCPVRGPLLVRHGLTLARSVQGFLLEAVGDVVVSLRAEQPRRCENAEFRPHRACLISDVRLVLHETMPFRECTGVLPSPLVLALLDEELLCFYSIIFYSMLSYYITYNL